MIRRLAASLAARTAGSFLLAVIFLLFGSTFVHMLSEHLWFEIVLKRSDTSGMGLIGGTEMWICGGPETVLWRTLPLYALLYFAICWQIAKLETTRPAPRTGSVPMAPWACLLGICFLENQRFSSLRYLVEDLEHNPQLLDDLILDGAYLLCALAASFLGAWLEGRPKSPAAGWGLSGRSSSTDAR